MPLLSMGVFDILWVTFHRALGAGQDLKEFDVDNKYGAVALTRILEDCTGKVLHMEAVKVERSGIVRLHQSAM